MAEKKTTSKTAAKNDKLTEKQKALQTALEAIEKVFKKYGLLNKQA